MSTAGLILAGGKSARMRGMPKAFLTIGGESFLDRIRKALAGLDAVYLSVGAREKYMQVPLPLVEDRVESIGPMGGIYSGLLACKEERLFVAACDMPFLTADFVTRICAAAQGPGYFAAVRRDGRIYPLGAVYKKAMLPLLESNIKMGNYQLKTVLEETHGKWLDFQELDIDDRVLWNINTLKEYEVIRAVGR